MKRIFMGVAALVLWAGTALGQANEAIEDVIGSQLQAFNDRDVTEAFSYASPMIQGIFREPQNFGMMVERGYPMVWDNSDVRFLDLREEQGMILQRVMIKDAEGVIHTLEYAMIETPNGWQINGVALVAPDLAA
ncbi:DUF4864 domain-containing protein [Loktanella sp. F6476L]|uniref:DUF4864 domain-containing protein n=1 Tax=Loktanella sp. F6476L TaxID=2926405 RepID=UPI001FF45F3D|nr:DUF4864 domain-containing protein [Loktanella sp. F6476L]MCK0121765.1 DUF4864 domain-containing protein [Loktanella sp. F6476L]UWQ98666.1 DUF4864 domain-containing protein [Rhodobacteraceae bacterium S2214]